MNYFLEASNRFKKNGMYIFLLDLATILLIAGIAIAVRYYLGLLVASAEGFAASLSGISNDAEGQLASALAATEPIVFRYNLVFYFLFPAAVFLAFGLLQAFSFGIAKEKAKKIYGLKYIANFLIFTLPSFVVFLFLITRMIEVLSIYLLPELGDVSYEIFASQARTTGWLALIVIISGYFLMIAYGLMLHNKPKKILLNIFRIGFRKFYLFVPLFLVFIAISSIAAGSFFAILISAVDSHISFVSLAIFIATMVGIAYLKILNALLTTKYQQES